MPTVAVARDDLFEALGKSYTEEEFDELCFQFGIELDEVTSEHEMKRKQNPDSAAEGEDRVIYKIDMPANRYDLLCLEGLVLALQTFLRERDPPKLRLLAPASRLRMTVKADTARIRPYIVCAVLRGLKLDHTKYNSFLDLQDKLHFNICRRRTLVAIGTHDLSTLTPPFTYEALPPRDISFKPLAQEKEFDAAELMEHYRTAEDCKHLREYTDIIYDSPVYPVIYDSDRTVLSVPPIINGEHSKIGPETRDCFIECTAVDYRKAQIVLNTIVAMFSAHCDEPFTVEPVEVVYEAEQPPRAVAEEAEEAGAGAGGACSHAHVYPRVEERVTRVSLARMLRLIGVDMPRERAVHLLSQMALSASAGEGDDEVIVRVPVTRSDVLHECDVAEDLAIAHGYNNIARSVPATTTVGREQPANKLSDLLRQEIAQCGYTEALTLGLCGRDENFAFLRREDDGSAVTLANPKTEEFQIARTSLLPGLLKTLRENRGLPVKAGIKLFEVSDVVLKDASVDVGARNERRLCAVYCGLTSGLEIVHGLVDRLMLLLHFRATYVTGGESAATSSASAGGGGGGGGGGSGGDGDSGEVPFGGPWKGTYRVEAHDSSVFFPGRAARVLVTPNGGEEVELGSLGIVHPEVLASFELGNPCSAVELNIEPFV